MIMDQDRPRPPAARWMQPNPRPFWGTKLFLLNMIVCSLLVMVAAIWVFGVEPARKARERAEIQKATTAKSYAPRAADSKEPKEVRFDGMLDRVTDDADPELR